MRRSRLHRAPYRAKARLSVYCWGLACDVSASCPALSACTRITEWTVRAAQWCHIGTESSRSDLRRQQDLRSGNALDHVDRMFLPVATGHFDAGYIPWIYSSAVVFRSDDVAAPLVGKPQSNRLKGGKSSVKSKARVAVSPACCASSELSSEAFGVSVVTAAAQGLSLRLAASSVRMGSVLPSISLTKTAMGSKSVAACPLP
jgi:hypothetical protein